MNALPQDAELKHAFASPNPWGDWMKSESISMKTLHLASAGTEGTEGTNPGTNCMIYAWWEDQIDQQDDQKWILDISTGWFFGPQMWQSEFQTNEM